MIDLLRYTFLFWLIVFLHQREVKAMPQDEIHTDAAVIPVQSRIPTSESMMPYYASADYKYQDEAHTKSWLDYLKEILNYLQERLGIKGSFLLTALILAGAAALVWLILILTNTPVKGLFLFSKNSALVSITLKSDSDINNPDLENMLVLYVQHKAYREAIRTSYLLILKQLHDNNLIVWNKNKTNRDYQYELRNHVLLAQFKSLTHHYEYSWYGHFTVDEALFESINSQFTDFKRAVTV